MKLYAIRERGTNKYLPHLKKAIGYSHEEPTNEKPIRFFHSRKGAYCALTQWLRGVHYKKTIYDTSGVFVDVSDEVIEITPQPHRKKEKMEIVEFTVLENKLNGELVWN